MSLFKGPQYKQWEYVRQCLLINSNPFLEGVVICDLVGFLTCSSLVSAFSCDYGVAQ